MPKTAYRREDFVNATEVRWCPGCGDYAILAALQKILPEWSEIKNALRYYKAK